MKAALIDNNNVVQNTIVVNELIEYPGAVACPEWISIGMDINDPEPVTSASQNKVTAIKRLAATDWVNEPDVIDPNVNPHLLNHADFITYRAALRTIAVNPQPGVLVWPTKPQEQWS
jgi:hypothetical protein